MTRLGNGCRGLKCKQFTPQERNEHGVRVYRWTLGTLALFKRKTWSKSSRYSRYFRFSSSLFDQVSNMKTAALRLCFLQPISLSSSRSPDGNVHMYMKSSYFSVIDVSC